MVMPHHTSPDPNRSKKKVAPPYPFKRLDPKRVGRWVKTAEYNDVVECVQELQTRTRVLEATLIKNGLIRPGDYQTHDESFFNRLYATYITQENPVMDENAKAAEIKRLRLMLREGADFLDSMAVFITSRQQIKRPEGENLLEDMIKKMRRVCGDIETCPTCGKDKDNGTP